jgi:hypothetical protein
MWESRNAIVGAMPVMFFVELVPTTQMGPAIRLGYVRGTWLLRLGPQVVPEYRGE